MSFPGSMKIVKKCEKHNCWLGNWREQDGGINNVKTVCQVVEMAASILDLAAVISDRTSARERIEWF